MSDLIALARRHKHIATHYEGCEADHIGCLVNKLADEIERQRAEIERLHQAHQAACEGGDLLRAENDRLSEVLRDIARTDYTDDPFCELTPEGLVRWRARHER